MTHRKENIEPVGIACRGPALSVNLTFRCVLPLCQSNIYLSRELPATSADKVSARRRFSVIREARRDAVLPQVVLCLLPSARGVRSLMVSIRAVGSNWR